MSDEYPIIDTDRRFKLYDEDGERIATVIPLGIWVDEDGETQIRVNDNWQEKRTLTVEDIHDRLDKVADYEVQEKAFA